MEVEFAVQPIATVREASLEDYEDSMTACAEARRMWMLVMHLVPIIILFKIELTSCLC